MVTVVGKDVDLTVLMALSPSEKHIFLFKTGRGKVKTKIFSSQELLKYFCAIFFLHSFSRSHTTSAIYRIDKLSIVKLLEKNE